MLCFCSGFELLRESDLEKWRFMARAHRSVRSDGSCASFDNGRYQQRGYNFLRFPLILLRAKKSAWKAEKHRVHPPFIVPSPDIWLVPCVILLSPFVAALRLGCIIVNRSYCCRRLPFSLLCSTPVRLSHARISSAFALNAIFPALLGSTTHMVRR